MLFSSFFLKKCGPAFSTKIWNQMAFATDTCFLLRPMFPFSDCTCSLAACFCNNLSTVHLMFQQNNFTSQTESWGERTFFFCDAIKKKRISWLKSWIAWFNLCASNKTITFDGLTGCILTSLKCITRLRLYLLQSIRSSANQRILK